MATDSLKDGSGVVSKFRQILIWPLKLRLREDMLVHDPRLWMRKCENWLCKAKKWQPVDSYQRESGSASETRYAEFVYFHPFVQRFLYPKHEPKHASPLRIFKRDDIRKVRIHLADDSELNLEVQRAHLYLFDMQIVTLVLEVYATEPLSIQTVEQILDQFRRVYPPYWENDGRGGHCLKKAEWLDCNGERVSSSDNQDVNAVSNYCDKQAFLDFVRDNRKPPVSNHWKFLLQPLAFAGQASSPKFALEHIGDERIPLMAYLALNNPRTLTQGDFIRLALAEEQGSSQTLPYAAAFLEDFERKYCYDRYWSESWCDQDGMTTRYLCCGYAFVVVGRDDFYDEEKRFFTDDKKGILAHFRYHYFQIGLIAHFHRAALLMISDQLSEAVAKFDPQDSKSKKGFHKQVHGILVALLRFTQRYWFPELSNHIQGRELFQFWSHHLDTQGLFEQVSREAQEINQFMDANEQQEQTRTSVYLTLVATGGLSLAIAAAFLSIADNGTREWLVNVPIHILEGYINSDAVSLQQPEWKVGSAFLMALFSLATAVVVANLVLKSIKVAPRWYARACSVFRHYWQTIKLKLNRPRE